MMRSSEYSKPGKHGLGWYQMGRDVRKKRLKLVGGPMPSSVIKAHVPARRIKSVPRPLRGKNFGIGVGP